MLSAMPTRKREKTFHRPEGDDTANLLDLAEALQKGQLTPPPHQRNFVWTEEQTRSWFETLEHVAEGGQRPYGGIGTYQVEGDPTVYLNDGFQRLTASVKYLEKAKNKAHARGVLGTYRISSQHRLYTNHEEAMFWFQKAQGGTPLTNSEYCHCFLFISNTDTDWLPLLNDLHKFCATIFPTENARRPSTKNQLWTRADYVLFYAWLNRSKETTAGVAPVSRKAIDHRAARARTTVEQKLIAKLEEIGVEEALQQFRSFEEFMTEEITLLHSLWREIWPGRTFPTVPLRWFSHAAMWRRNNNLTKVSWELFVRNAYPYITKGSHFVKIEDGMVHVIGLPVGSCTGMNAIAEWTHNSTYKQIVISNSGRANQIRLGYAQP